MRVINRKTYKISKFSLIVIGSLLLAYAIFTAYNVSTKYAMEEREMNIAQLEKENMQLRVSQAQSSSLEYISDESGKMLYIDTGRVTYIERPSTSPFAVLSDYAN